MGQSKRTRVVCPQCLSSDHPGDVTCFLCGHGLENAVLDIEIEATKSRTSSSSPESIDPFAPPTSESSPNVTFRISSLLLVIAVIAVCLAVAHENPILGILLAVVVVPALVYSFVVVEKRSARGSPVAIRDKAVIFVVAIGDVLIIKLSGLIAFCITSYAIVSAPVASGGAPGLIPAIILGGIAGVAAAWYVTYLLVFRKGRNPRNHGKP
jgi:hypothetical protein